MNEKSLRSADLTEERVARMVTHLLKLTLRVALSDRIIIE